MIEGHSVTRPVAARHPQHRVFHGDDVIDDYEWLRDSTDPAVKSFLNAHNAYTDDRTAHLAPLRTALYDEIAERTVETDMSAPTRAGQWWYFIRTSEGEEYWEQCRCPLRHDDDWTPPKIVPNERLDGEQVIFDANALAKGSSFFSLGSFDVSADGNWLLYGLDTKGDERFEIRVKNLETGELLNDVIPNTAAGAALSKDATYVFYATVDDSWRPDKIWRHRLGDPHDAEDTLILHEPDDRYWCGVGGLTRSREYFTLDVGSSVTNETLISPADDPLAPFTPIWPREEGVEYDVTHAILQDQSVFVITHNRNAPNGETVVVSASDPTSIAFTLLPHDETRRIEGVSAFRDFLVVDYREDGLTQAGLITLDLTAPHGLNNLAPINVDLPLFTLGTGGGEWEQPNIRVSLTSFVTPRTLQLLDVATGARTELKKQVVNGDFDPANYRQARVWAPAGDGKKIPISLVWRATDDAALPQNRPTLLYGYGAYEASMDPGFSIPRLSLLDRGVVFAIAHVRGGGELGRAWYEDGRILHKRNTFTDFIDAARHLIDLGCTTPAQLAARGGSAGGLLMGAITNMAPELFCAVHAAVPFVDALTSILKPELPLTVIEWDEWGDPVHNADVYWYMKSYTPYENVHDDATYPHILATTSLNDTRVLCVEPAKWVARLTALGHDALLRTEMHAGHGGVSGKYAQWRDSAWEDAWLLDQLDATERVHDD